MTLKKKTPLKPEALVPEPPSPRETPTAPIKTSLVKDFGVVCATCGNIITGHVCEVDGTVVQ